MDFKNCKHYNEIVRVLAENIGLEGINFKLEDNIGCECKDGDSVCELWINLALAHDMAPQLGIVHAEQTIANLDSRMKEITTMLVSSVSNKPENIEETEETIPETNIYNQSYVALPSDKQELLEQLSQMGDVTYIKSNLSKYELIVNAISEMDIDLLEILVENHFKNDEKEEFIAVIKSEFNIFKENKDTYLIPLKGQCEGGWCKNHRKYGYSFTGNNSNTFHNLVFEEENGECTGICKCYSFKVDDAQIANERQIAKQKEIDSYGFTDSDIEDLPF